MGPTLKITCIGLKLLFNKDLPSGGHLGNWQISQQFHALYVDFNHYKQ